jgi:hypothetical protein
VTIFHGSLGRSHKASLTAINFLTRKTQVMFNFGYYWYAFYGSRVMKLEIEASMSCGHIFPFICLKI